MKNNKFVKLIRYTITAFSAGEMSVYSGYATLYILMAMVPLLMLVIAAVNLLPGFSAEDFSNLVFRMLPEIPEVKEMLKEIISNLNRQSSGIVASVSALTSLWSASNGLSAIQTGLEKLYGTQRPSLVGKPMALAFTLLYILLIPSLLIFQVLRSTLTDTLKAILAKIGLVSFAGNIGGILRLSGIVVLALMILVIVLTYTYLPNGKRTVKSQLPGSVFSCILWTVFTFGFAFFIPRFWKASSFYGSLAAVFLSAMWLKFIITILFYGASLNKSCAELFGAEKTEDKA